MVTGTTKSTNLIIPQVLADMVQAELEKQVRLTPLAVVDTTLVGRPGDTLTVPAWDYIGDATDLTEGDSIEITQMSTTEKTMKIKQIGKAVEITDYALQVGYDDALATAALQIAQSHAQKIDEDFLTTISAATLSETATGGLTVENLEKAIAKFNDEDIAQMAIIANPQDALKLQADARKLLVYADAGADALISGTVGRVLGADLVRARRVPEGTAYLVKQGALRLVKKRDVNLETDRDILKKSTVISADSIYGTYLYDAKKVVKITIS